MPSSAADGKVELDTFLGEWRDSMGNKVNVEWAKGRSSRGELDVWLTTRGNKHIQLGVRSQPGGNFACGHYNLNTHESGTDHIVWVDLHDKKKTSIWKRPNDSSSDRGWDHRGSRSHDSRDDWNKHKNWKRDDDWKQSRDKWNSRDDNSWKDRDLIGGKDGKEHDNDLCNSDTRHDDYEDSERLSNNKGSWKRDDSRERHRDPAPGVISKAAPRPSTAPTQSSKVPEPAFPPRGPQPKRMPGMSGGAGADGRGRRENDDSLFSQLAAGLAAPASESDMFGQLGAPTSSLDPAGRPPAQDREVGSHMTVAAPSTGNSEPAPGKKKLHIHVPLGRPASSSPSATGAAPSPGRPGAAPSPPGAMLPPPGAAPPLPHSMPPMGSPPAFPPSPHPDSLQQHQPPPGYPTAFSADPRPESSHQQQPPPSYPGYPPPPHYPAYPGYQTFPPQPPYWHHPPPPPPHQFPPSAPPEVRTPTESKPPPAAAEDIPKGKIVCDGGELLENEGRLVFDGGNIVTGLAKSQKRTQPSDLDDIPDGPIICDGGNMWIGERLRYEETQPKMQHDAPDASETRSLQQALTETLKNLGSDLVMGNSSMLDDYEEGDQSDEPLDVVVDPNGSKPIDPRSANTPKPTDPRGAGRKRKRDESQTLMSEVDQDEI